METLIEEFKRFQRDLFTTLAKGHQPRALQPANRTRRKRSRTIMIHGYADA